jgi:hypothetical protein
VRSEQVERKKKERRKWITMKRTERIGITISPTNTCAQKKIAKLPLLLLFLYPAAQLVLFVT